MEIIHENEYVYKMNDEIEPYLATHRQEGYIPGAEDHLHRKDMGIVGKFMYSVTWQRSRKALL